MDTQNSTAKIGSKIYFMAEYNALRYEILNCITIQNNYIIAMYTITITILVLAVEQESEVLFLLPYAIIFPFQSSINSKRNNMIKIGLYIKEFYEDETGWEHRNALIRGQIYISEKEGGKKLKPVNFMYRLLRRTGSIQLGIICSTGAILFHYMNLRIPINELINISAVDTIIYIVAIILLIFAIYVNSSVWNVDLIQKKYTEIIHNLK